MISWPSEGAMIGTARKTMNTSDITRAICRPAKRSRTMEMASTRVAAAQTPENATWAATLERIDDARLPIAWETLPVATLEGGPALHDHAPDNVLCRGRVARGDAEAAHAVARSEEHTSELQSH